MQGSSVPCERLFSSTALIDTKRHNKLSTDSFSGLEILKQHFLRLHKCATNPDVSLNSIQFDPDAVVDSDDILEIV